MGFILVVFKNEDQNRIEEFGLKPLHDIFRKLGGWPVLDGDSWNEDSGAVPWVHRVAVVRVTPREELF